MGRGRTYYSVGINQREAGCSVCGKTYKGSVKMSTKLLDMHFKKVHPDIKIDKKNVTPTLTQVKAESNKPLK